MTKKKDREIKKRVMEKWLITPTLPDITKPSDIIEVGKNEVDKLIDLTIAECEKTRDENIEASVKQMDEYIIPDEINKERQKLLAEIETWANKIENHEACSETGEAKDIVCHIDLRELLKELDRLKKRF